MRHNFLKLSLALPILTIAGVFASRPATAVSFYSITNLGSTNYDSFNYLGELAVGGKTYNATTYVTGSNVFLNDASVIDLSTFAPSYSPDGTTAVAINNLNQVTGNTGYAQSFFWSQETGFTLINAPGPGGYISASDINNLGQVVGTAGAPSAGSEGYVWSLDGPDFNIGLLPDIDPGLGGTSAIGINDNGQVVGYFGSSSLDNDFRAILYEEGTLYNLNNLIPANSGWTLLTAFDINNQGQIVGTGVVNGQEQDFLLTPTNGTDPQPVPEPSTTLATLALGAFGALKMLKHKRKQRHL
jgi:probable HAF family extracellular repeat protein